MALHLLYEGMPWGEVFRVLNELIALVGGMPVGTIVRDEDTGAVIVGGVAISGNGGVGSVVVGLQEGLGAVEAALATDGTAPAGSIGAAVYALANGQQPDTGAFPAVLPLTLA